VITNVSCRNERYTALKRFLKQTLALKVIEQTAVQHDEEMARVQALTHLIGRAITELQIGSYATNTKSYSHLLELKELLKNDSWELFVTIQNANPQAEPVRKAFLDTITSLEQRLSR
jgi:prephenate dehydrogenase